MSQDNDIIKYAQTHLLIFQRINYNSLQKHDGLYPVFGGLPKNIDYGVNGWLAKTRKKHNTQTLKLIVGCRFKS